MQTTDLALFVSFMLKLSWRKDIFTMASGLVLHRFVEGLQHVRGSDQFLSLSPPPLLSIVGLMSARGFRL